MDTSPQDSTLQETLLQQITRTYYELLPAFERQIGVTRARWHLLKQLFAEPQLSQSALQQRVGVDGAAVTRQMKQLEEAGMVVRRVDPRDNRFTLVSLTPVGREQVGKLLERRALFEAHVMAGIDPQQVAAMQHGLSRIRMNLATFRQPASVQAGDEAEPELAGGMPREQA
jgi:DNA-binding MarR family transcriptional regulator